MKRKKRNKNSSIKADKLIISIVLASFIILAGAVFLAGRIEAPPEVVASQNAKAQVETTQHDWGEIKLNGGDVKKTFVISNVGTNLLHLVNIQTSCMCTTAQVKTGEDISPRFGMHSRSSWIGKVPVGKQAELEIVFDPAYHGPSGIGPIMREVVVETNDKTNPKLTFTLSANVVN